MIEKAKIQRKTFRVRKNLGELKTRILVRAKLRFLNLSTPLPCLLKSLLLDNYLHKKIFI